MTKAALINFKDTYLTTEQKITGYNNLGVKLVRFSIVTTEWTGRSVRLEQLIDAGFRILLNIGYNSVTPAPYCVNIPEYIRVKKEILTLYGKSCDVVVVENEETNGLYFDKPEINHPVYLAQLSASIPVVHSFGLKITNGGITLRDMTLFMYRHYMEKGLLSKANDFASLCITDRFLIGLQNPGRNAAIDNTVLLVKTLLAAYKKMDLDFMNWHIYEQAKYRGEPDAYNLTANTNHTTKGFIAQCSSVIHTLTGKQATTNEIGQVNDNPELTTSSLNALKRANYPFACWYAGDGDKDDARGLNNLPLMDNRPTGDAFKNHV